MPRVKSKSRNELVDSALNVFWREGYSTTSMGDLVRETGVSRSGIYSDFVGKDELFRACLERYQDVAVTPFFYVVEQEGAGFEAIETYLNKLINAFETHGDAGGIGCLVSNSVGQVATDDQQTQALLNAHGQRLKAGFQAVLTHENQANKMLSDIEVDALAGFTMIFVQGLSMSMRNNTDSRFIRQQAETLMKVLRESVDRK